MTAYVTAADVIVAMPVSSRPDPDSDDPTDVAKVARISSLCASTAQMIDAELGADFGRHPAEDPYDEDATVSWIVDAAASRRLHVHAGIVSLATVEYRYGAGDWTAHVDGDWELESMFVDEDPDRPYDHVHRVGYRWPAGLQNIRLTGVRGWASPPARLVEMNVAWVRQHLAAGDSFSGAVQVPEGGFVPTPRLVMPDDVRMFLTVEKGRFRECYT
jgi:hypothetical protein